MIIVSWNINNDYRDIDDKIQMIIELLNTKNIDMFGIQEVIPELYDKLYTRISKKLGLDYQYYISDKPMNKLYFTVLISKCDKAIYDVNFSHTNMGRSFIYQYIDKFVFVTTHLESLPMNEHVRKKQISEIYEHVDVKNIIVFGDMNFTNKGEIFLGFDNLYTEHKDIYTYDSKHNRNATPPYRSNLDRFYTNCRILKYKMDILTDYNISDHYPIMLTFN